MTKKSEKPTKQRKHKNALAKIFYRAAHQAVDSPLPEILFISTFILIRWWNNSDFSYPSEILLPLALFSALAAVIYYVYRLILGAGFGAHIAALSLTYLLYIFQFIEGTRFGKFVEAILPQSLSSPFSRSIALALVLGVLCGLFGWATAWLVDRYGSIKRMQPFKVLLFAISFIFLVQLSRTGMRLMELHDQLSYKYNSLIDLKASTSSSGPKPDIFYIVFDRYTNDEVLKENFGYNNSIFSEYLSANGFISRKRSFSNYPFTMSSISSTQAMSYFPEFRQKFENDGKWQSAAAYRSILNDPPIAKILKKHGYEYNQVSSWWDFTRVGIKADKNPSLSYRLRVLGKSYYLSDLQRDIVFKSILSPWLKKGASEGNSALIKYDLDRNPRENFEAQIESLEKISSRTDKKTPSYSFAHILAPHPPYVFDEDGNQPKYDGESNDTGLDERIKYINEVIYVNKRLKDLVAYIKKNSPEAVVILQADEGPYPKQFRGPLTADNYYDPLKLPQPQLKQKFGVQTQYLMPGVSSEEISQINSSVNVFRFVLNKYLGYDLPMLPDCQFSVGNKFQIYNYKLVNEKLDNQSSVEQCRAYE